MKWFFQRKSFGEVRYSHTRPSIEKLTTQAITVVNNFIYLPFCFSNGPCSTKRRSYFGKILIFFPDSDISIKDYNSRLENNQKSEENPVSIFFIYFPETKSPARYIDINIVRRYGHFNKLPSNSSKP